MLPLTKRITQFIKNITWHYAKPGSLLEQKSLVNFRHDLGGSALAEGIGLLDLSSVFFSFPFSSGTQMSESIVKTVTSFGIPFAFSTVA